MSAASDDLSSLKDDMVAFIEGHGMRRFHGYVDFEEVQCVMWKDGQNPESWKDFVGLAKAAGASFLTMDASMQSRSSGPSCSSARIKVRLLILSASLL